MDDKVLHYLIPKIIGIISGTLAVTIFAWKLRQTPLCWPRFMCIKLAACKPFETDIMYAEIEPELSRMKKLEFRPGQFEIDVLNDRRPEFSDSITRHLQNSFRIK